MIEDEELRALFKVESEEHLQRLDDGLLQLEKNAKDQHIIEEVFRSAHSLKGAARMLGVQDVETVAHRFEDTLGAAKRGTAALSHEMVDRLYGALDGIRKLVHEAVTGKPAGIDVLNILDQLTRERRKTPRGPKSRTAHATAAAPEKEAPRRRAVDLNPELAEVPLAADAPRRRASDFSETVESRPAAGDEPAATTTYRIDTIRVDPRKLDVLMTQAGELSVGNIHLAHRLGELHELLALAEEWGRDVSSNRSLPAALNGTDPAGTQKRLVQFTERGFDRVERLGALLGRLASAFREDHKRLEFIANELEEGIRTVRLLPLSTIFNLYPRMVRDIGRELGKEVELILEGGDTAADKQIIEEMKDPLMHMIRNSIDHGIETPDYRESLGKPTTGTIRLRAYQTATNIVIDFSDDGRGLDAQAIKRTALKRKLFREEDLAGMSDVQLQALIFTAGFSTKEFITDLSGRGVGMDVVKANVDRLKGSIRFDSTPKRGVRFQIRLPLTLATMRVLIVALAGRRYAIPVESVLTSRFISSKDLFPIEGREALSVEGQPVSVSRLADLLTVRQKKTAKPREGRPAENGDLEPCVILTDGTERVGFLVDALLDEQEVVLKPHNPLFGRVPNVAGSAILGTGEVCIVLNSHDLIHSSSSRVEALVLTPQEPEKDGRRRVVLLADDSITTRTQEKRILESAGYEVITAVDGADALNKLRGKPVDAVVSDVEMPNLDGLKLTESIRKNSRFKDLPVILVTSLSQEQDRQRGLEAGANAYLTKPTFDQKVFLETLRRLMA